MVGEEGVRGEGRERCPEHPTPDDPDLSPPELVVEGERHVEEQRQSRTDPKRQSHKTANEMMIPVAHKRTSYSKPFSFPAAPFSCLAAPFSCPLTSPKLRECTARGLLGVLLFMRPCEALLHAREPLPSKWVVERGSD